MSAIPLNPGINLVGLPLMDSRITRVSDLFALGGIAGVVGSIVITDNGEFRLVGRAGDAGDIPVTGGQGFILIVQGAATIPISGDAWDNTLMTGEDGKTRRQEGGKGESEKVGKGALPYLAPAGRHVYSTQDTQTS